MSQKSSSDSPKGAVKVSKLTLEYPVYSSVVGGRFATVARSFLPFASGNRKKVLDDLSFEISPGEGVGLVGVNGAGKTSLLKVISGLVAPTKGHVQVGGRVVALLAMGVGLRHHLTGRENIWFGGLLFGMTRQEIAERLDDIIAFADIGSAIDQPYFTYSTGMRSRLGFALATSTPGDVYILDETLATGDVRFVAKCYQRIRSIRDSGRTVLFVSHNLGEIARMTKRVLVLDSGRLRFDGDSAAGLQVYESIVHAPRAADSDVAGLAQAEPLLDGIDGLRAQVTLLPEQSVYAPGSPLEIEVRLESEKSLGNCYVNLFVYDIETGTPVCYLSPNRWESLNVPGQIQEATELRRGATTLRTRVPELVLGEGQYSIDVRVEPVAPETGLPIDQTRTFRAVADLFVTYQNHRFKGAGTALEMPVKQWQVASDASST